MALDYFAYGNNLNPEMLRRKGLNIERRTPARLHGYQLVFNKASQRAALPEVIGFANLEPRTDATVEGTLYSIPDDQQPVLDKGERYPAHYDRVTITVETSEGERSAITYVARAEHTREGLIPSPELRQPHAQRWRQHVAGVPQLAGAARDLPVRVRYLPSRRHRAIPAGK